MLNCMLAWFFWLGSALVVYTYLGYGVLLYLLVRLRPRRRVVHARGAPAAVTLIIPAYNEAALILDKLANTLQLAYPPGKLTVFFVTDGSTDGTEARLRGVSLPVGSDVRVLHAPERRGKLAAVERAMSLVETPFVVFSDANTRLNTDAVANLVAHFADPQVGAVAGEKRVALRTGVGAQGVGEGLYWRYESWLKRQDAALYSTVGAAGELFSVRTALYESVPPDTIIEDFYLSMRIAMRGYRVAYAADAYAVESYSISVEEELKRKVRIAAGGLQAIGRLPALLNPFRYGVLSFQYVSHRVLRWTVAPLLLPLLFGANMWLAARLGGFYWWPLAGQLLFYAMAAIGFLLERLGTRAKLVYIPYYFCVMNYAVYAGALRLWRGRQSAVWERAARA